MIANYYSVLYYSLKNNSSTESNFLKDQDINFQEIAEIVNIEIGYNNDNKLFYLTIVFKDQFQKCRDATTDPRTLNMLNGFEKTVDNSDESPEMIKELITTLNNIDKRRGTNWKILWPWLKEIEDGI